MTHRSALSIAISALLASLLGAGCGPEYYCSDFDDVTGRAVVFCSNPRADPVCDYPGEEARFEEGTMGFELVGGERAYCNADLEVICPLGTLEPPRCIIDPEL